MVLDELANAPELEVGPVAVPEAVSKAVSPRPLSLFKLFQLQLQRRPDSLLPVLFSPSHNTNFFALALVDGRPSW